MSLPEPPRRSTPPRPRERSVVLLFDAIGGLLIPGTAVLVGLLAHSLLDTYGHGWPGVVVISVSIAAALGWSVAMGLIYLRFRVLSSMVEDLLRGRPFSPTKQLADVFISYRHLEHYDHVQPIAESLEREGLSVWSDQGKRGLPTKFLGLDLMLKNGIQESRAVLYLLPSDADARTTMPPAPRGLAPRAWLKWLADTFVTLIIPQALYPIHALIRGWHRLFYGVDLEKQKTESWQRWEQRVADEMGIPIVATAVEPSEAAEAAASVHVATLRVDRLDEDLRERVLPRLSGVPDRPRELEFRPGKRRLFIGLTVLIAIAVAVLAAAMLFGELLATVLSPFAAAAHWISRVVTGGDRSRKS